MFFLAFLYEKGCFNYSYSFFFYVYTPASLQEGSGLKTEPKQNLLLQHSTFSTTGMWQTYCFTAAICLFITDSKVRINSKPTLFISCL